MKKVKENPISYKLSDIPIKSIKVWEEAQARKLDEKDIESLAKSIKEEGLQNPLMLQRNGKGSYLLMAGQRRLSALKTLGMDKVPALVLDEKSAHSVVKAKAVSIIENMHRKDMNSQEMAKSCQFLVDKVGKVSAAKTLGINPATLREYLGFGSVPENIRELVPDMISKRDAIKLCKIESSAEVVEEIIRKITKYGDAGKKRYIAALETLGTSVEHSIVLKMANSFRSQRNISMKLTKEQADGLASIALKADQEPAEYAERIIKDYLVKQGFK